MLRYSTTHHFTLSLTAALILIPCASSEDVVLTAGSPQIAQAGTRGASCQAEIESWRRARVERLKAEDGWLSVAGLFWLREGINTVGAGPRDNIVLPPGSAPDVVGFFEFHKGMTTFQPALGVTVTVNGGAPTWNALKSDTPGPPDLLRIRDLTMFVIQRGSRFGIRLRDKNSEARKAFRGLKYFPVKDEYRVKAKFVPYRPPRKIAIPNILGETEDDVSPGYAEFTLNGHKCRLEPVTEGDLLFFIFKDLTAGKETYPAGRFLYTEKPKAGAVILDFNRAVNPPCAFTDFATCPLPPQQNQLPLRIEAGEMRYGH